MDTTTTLTPPAFKHGPVDRFEDQWYTVWSLDVWGHGHDECESWGCDGNCEGFTVNDRGRCGTVTVRAQGFACNIGTEHEFVSFVPTTLEIKTALVEAGHLNDQADIEIDGEDVIEVNAADNGRPLFQLERSSS